MNEFLTEDRNGVVWVCIRPKKRYTRLRMSVQAPGYAKLPTLVDELAPPAELRLDEEGRLWAKGLPPVEALRERALSDVEWFYRRVLERQAGLRVVRDHMVRLAVVDLVDKKDEDLRRLLSTEVREWRRLHEEVFHLVLLNALVVDQIGDEFFRFLVKELGNRMALEHTGELFRTLYAEEARRRKTSFHEHADLNSTIEQYPVPRAETNTSPTSKLEGEVMAALTAKPLETRAGVLVRYCRLRLVAPMLVQLNDEQAYVWRAYGRVVMRALQEFERRRRETDPDYSVGERSFEDLLLDLGTEDES